MSIAQAIPLLIVAVVLGGVATWWFLTQRGATTTGDAPKASSSGSARSTSSSARAANVGRRELLEAADDKVSTENRELREKVSSLNGRIKKLESRAGKFDREVADADARTAAANARIEGAESALAAAIAEHDATRTELRTLHGEQAATPAAPAAEETPTVDVAALESAAAEARRAQGKAEERLAKFQSDVDNATRLRRDAERDRDEARKLFDQANRERGAARAEVATLRAQLGMPPATDEPAADAPGTAPARRVTQLSDDEARRVPMPPGSGEATSGPDPDDDDDDVASEAPAAVPAEDEADESTPAVAPPADPAPAVDDTPTPDEQPTAEVAEVDGVDASAAAKPDAPKPAFDGAPTPAVVDEDDLTRINGVDAAIQDALRSSGIGTYRALSMASPDAVDGALDRADISEISARDTWSRQAARLADGDERGFAALTATLADEAEAARIAESMVDLTRVEGVGPKINVVLHRAGIDSFEALAAATGDELDAALEAGGVRFAPSKETWAEQAQLLADGDEAGFEALAERLVSDRQSD